MHTTRRGTLRRAGVGAIAFGLGLSLPFGSALWQGSAEAGHVAGGVHVTKKNTNIRGVVKGIVVDVDGAHINLSQGVVDCEGVAGSVGIEITGKTGVHINGSGTGKVTRCEVGILISGGGGHRINGLNIIHNGWNSEDIATHTDPNWIGGGDGIRLEESTGNHIAGNNISFNARIGIHLVRSDGNQINGNHCEENEGPPFCGCLRLRGSSHNTVHSNTMPRNGDFGILLDSAFVEVDEEFREIRPTGNKITSNVIEETNFGSDPFGDPTLRGDPQPGIEVDEGDRNVFLSNVSNRNLFGIFLEGFGDATSNVLRGNITNDNIAERFDEFVFGGDGIHVEEDATNNRIQGNTSLGNEGLDLVDENLDCDANTWQGNVFGTINQDCVGAKSPD